MSRTPPAKARLNKSPNSPKSKPETITPESLVDGPSDVATISDETEIETVDFSALAAVADMAIENPDKTPRNTSHMGEGDSYVRMINLTGHVQAVSCRLVPDRYMDGYRFIVDEPSVPIHTTPIGHSQKVPMAAVGNPDFIVRARSTAKADNSRDACKVWIAEMRNDIPNFRKLANLDWQYVRTLGDIIAGLNQE